MALRVRAAQTETRKRGLAGRALRQRSQGEEAFESWSKVPLAHVLQVVAFSGEYLPEAQLVHTEEGSESPSCVPFAQFTHTVHFRPA